MEYSPPVPDYTYTGREQSPRDAGVEEVRSGRELQKERKRDKENERDREK